MTVRNAACATCVAVGVLVSATFSMRGLSAQEPHRAIVVDARSPAQRRDWDSSSPLRCMRSRRLSQSRR